mgnify:CR=1 FL=1
MKQLLSVLMVILILVTTSVIVQASYYDVKVNIGEYTSDISNQLFLNYDQQLQNYKFAAEIKLNKDYRFLEGKSYEEDWQYQDYFMRFSNQTTELEIGETEAESLSEFLAAESLLGASIKRKKYNFWYGKNANEDFSFGGQNSGLERIGFSYDGKKRKVGYQYQEDLVTDRHYFSYQEGYKYKGFDFLIDTAAARTDEEIGPAVKFDLSSWFQGINYRWITTYYSPDYQAIEQNIFASGQYDTSLKLYKKLSSRYILESRIKYSEDNLNNSQSFTNRDWSLDNTLSYFSPHYNIYQVGFDYKINNYSDNSFKLNMNGDLDQLSFQLRYHRQLEEEIYAEVDYEGSTYSYSFNYSADEDEDKWSHDAETEVGYKTKLNDRLKTNSIVNLSYLYDEYRINLTQALEYKIAPQQTLEGRLAYNYYFANDDYNQKVIVHYKYDF